MGKETERRFLVQSQEWRELAGAGVHYRQGYLSTDVKRNVRIRVGDTDARITIKGEAKGFTRPEFEYPIPLCDAEDLEQLCLKILEKTRYTLKQDGLTWEIDEYRGEDEGLMVAEVETESEAPSAKPHPGSDLRFRAMTAIATSTWSNIRSPPGVRDRKSPTRSTTSRPTRNFPMA